MITFVEIYSNTWYDKEHFTTRHSPYAGHQRIDGIQGAEGIAGVSDELRKKITDLAEEHAYHPNPLAMSLRHNTTHMIGIIVPDMSFNHYAHIVKWLETEARERGYMCIITDSGDKYEGEVECIDHLLNMHVEGIAMCLSQETANDAHLQRVKQRNVPLVLFDRVANIDCLQ